jgi:DNA adenine methylase
MRYKRLRNEIRSPLRYPGGKSRAIKTILPHIPHCHEFREPFVGGGSVFIAAKQRWPRDAIFRINDKNYDLYCFWKQLQIRGQEFIQSVLEYKDTWTDGQQLYNHLIDSNQTWDDFDRSIRFFILNRITFSGTVEAGGYSDEAFRVRFTPSSITRLKRLPQLLHNVEITHGDYSKLLDNGDDVFIFLDPPYYSTTRSKLYGKNGRLHTSFNHEQFAKHMRDCKAHWLITYDDSPTIRELFSFAYIYEWTLQYGMNNYQQPTAKKGNELFITNYELQIINETDR